MPEADDFAAEAERARALLDQTSGTLVPLGAAAPEHVRTAYSAQLADLARSQQNLQTIYNRRKEELEARLKAELAALQAVAGPLEAQIRRLQEGIWTVNLYLGRDEEIEQLADGAPAPAGTPITLRQLVLAMDEECLVAAEEGQGIDSQDIGKFVEWLLADPAHLQQVLPDAKGVVVLVPSRQKRDYGSLATQQAAEEANSVSYWLLRNGDRLFLMTTDIKVGDRLLPTRAEFVQYFYSDRYNSTTRERERVPMDPGGEAWVKAEAAADARRRHFMRLMLILQGIVDRTTVWQPLPSDGVNFLSVGAQDDGKVVIINELDNVLTSGRKPFREWQVEQLRALTPGQRVIGAFNSWDFTHHAAGEWDRQRNLHARLQPGSSTYPPAAEPHVLETVAGRDGAMTFLFERDVWEDWERRPAKTRARCTVYPTDSWLLPFDGVTIEDLESYLHARTERQHYLKTIPVIKAAIAAKRAEARAEEPFRRLLAGRIADVHNLDVADVEGQIGELVDWWKLTNRWHRPLVAAPATEAKAVTAIEREWAARRAAAGRGSSIGAADQHHLAALRALHPAAVCIARRRDGDYVAYLPANAEDIWVHERRYHPVAGRRRDLRLVRETDWTQVPLRTVPTLTVLHADRRWAVWDHRAHPAEHLTGPERDQFVNELRDTLTGGGATPVAVTYEPDHRMFHAFGWAAVPRSPRERSGISEPGELMVGLAASWARRPGRLGAVLNTPTWRDHPTWHRYSEPEGHPTPWRPANSAYRETGDRLVWLDDTQMPRVNEVWAEIRARHAAARRRTDAMLVVLDAVNRRWVEWQKDQAYQRFIADYAGATDLWEGHLKTLKFSENINHADGLREGIYAFQAEGVDLAGLTVADAVRRGLNPEQAEAALAKLPDGAAGLLLAVAAEGR